MQPEAGGIDDHVNITSIMVRRADGLPVTTEPLQLLGNGNGLVRCSVADHEAVNTGIAQGQPNGAGGPTCPDHQHRLAGRVMAILN